MLLGDGFVTHLIWRGPAGGANADPSMVHFRSPARGSIRDLWLLANAAGTSRPGGVLIDSTDDAGAVLLDQGLASYAKSLVDMAGLDKVRVRADQSSGTSLERMLAVLGGGAGGQTSSRTKGITMFAGGGASLAGYAELRNWGKAVLIGVDNEGQTQGASFGQSGFFTMLGGRMIVGPVPGSYASYFASQPNFIVESTFRGRAAFVNIDDRAGIFATSAPEAQVLSLGNWYDWDTSLMAPAQPTPVACPAVGTPTACPFTQQNPTALANNLQMALQDGSWCDAGGGARAPYYCADQVGSPAAEAAFVTTMLADLRATYSAPQTFCSQTAVRMHRVAFQGYATGNPSDFGRPAFRVQRF